MKRYSVINKIIVVVCAFCALSLAWAAKTPLWKFTPLTATSITVPTTGTATVIYQVTNQSGKAHSLVMKPQKGVSQTGPCILGPADSTSPTCTLTLLITGSAVPAGGISSGPVLCQANSDGTPNPNQCYQPSSTNSLNINKGEINEYTVGGSTYGLHGTLVLQNNGGDAFTMTADGLFTFSTPLASGSTYSVTVHSQPAGETCTVDNGEGVISNANITNVVVHCSTNAHTVGGTVTGLSGTVVLQNNGGDNLVINTSGSFTFPTSVAEGATYMVTVLNQPIGQICTVKNDSGTMGTTNVTNVTVICSANMHTVGGTITGLSGTIVLQNNLGDDLTLSSNGTFTFATPVAQGATYMVTILSEPAPQNCTVSNGSGTMGSTNVTNVSVTCVTHTTTLTTSISDLALSVPGHIEYGVETRPNSGVPRSIIIRNSGSHAASNVSVNAFGLPAGTSITTNTCSGTLNVEGACMITVTPGVIPNSDGTNPCYGGTAPEPGVVQVMADNSNTVSTNVVVLDYGCIYQEGYVFAFDDTTLATASVGGKAAMTSDLTNIFANNFTWSQALALCEQANVENYANWYLPGICEMGYDTENRGSGCGSSSMPAFQNMQSNLVDYNGLDLLNARYWSSTGYSADSNDPPSSAWAQFFAPTTHSNQRLFNTNSKEGVRCIRYINNVE